MNVLQRGVRSVLRKPIKSIILLFIVIVMSGLFLGAMASRSAPKRPETLGRSGRAGHQPDD